MIRTTCLAILICMGSPVVALSPGEIFDDPALEARAREIGRGLRCLVCRNQSIFDSNAGIAEDLRGVVRERIVAGDSDEEILAYIRERFGDYVLLEPPFDAHTAVLWATPILFLGLGGLVAASYMRRRRQEPAGDGEGAKP